MALTVSDNALSTDSFTFLDSPLQETGEWLALFNSGPKHPVVFTLKGQHPGLCCIVLNLHPDTDVIANLTAILSRDTGLLCTDTRVVLLPPVDNADKTSARERYQHMLSWQPDFFIDVSIACCPEPLAFGYRRQAGSAALGSLFSPYTVNGSYAASALTRFPWPCASIELLLPRYASDDILRSVCQTLSELEVTANNDAPHTDNWLRTVYRLDVLKAASVTFAERPVFGMNVTLDMPRVRKAFVTLHPGESLGWLDHNGLDHLRLKGASAEERLTDFFDASDNRLLVRVPLTCFLLADSVDCLREQGLLYFSPVRC